MSFGCILLIIYGPCSSFIQIPGNYLILSVFSMKNFLHLLLPLLYRTVIMMRDVEVKKKSRRHKKYILTWEKHWHSSADIIVEKFHKIFSRFFSSCNYGQVKKNYIFSWQLFIISIKNLINVVDMILYGGVEYFLFPNQLCEYERGHFYFEIDEDRGAPPANSIKWLME